jgi:transcriptional regulator with XRE-family HTH domain
MSKMDTDGGWRAGVAGRRIREQRERMGLTQEELADGLRILGVPTTALEVSRRERGARRLTIDVLFAYAIVLRCGVVDLLVDDDGMCQITPHDERLVLPFPTKRPRRREPLAVVTLTRDELRAWLARTIH